MDRFWFSSRAEAEKYARQLYGRDWRRKVKIERPGGAFHRKAGWVIRGAKGDARPRD